MQFTGLKVTTVGLKGDLIFPICEIRYWERIWLKRPTLRMLTTPFTDRFDLQNRQFTCIAAIIREMATITHRWEEAPDCGSTTGSPSRRANGGAEFDAGANDIGEGDIGEDDIGEDDIGEDDISFGADGDGSGIPTGGNGVGSPVGEDTGDVVTGVGAPAVGTGVGPTAGARIDGSVHHAVCD